MRETEDNNKFGDTLLKWIAILIFGFLVFVIAAIILAYNQGAFAYEFVYCHHQTTNSTITYPEGVICDNQYSEEPEETQDEEEHEKESREWNENGWTKLK